MSVGASAIGRVVAKRMTNLEKARGDNRRPAGQDLIDRGDDQEHASNTKEGDCLGR